MKLYYGKTRKGYWLASTNESKLKMPEVFVSEVKTVNNNKVYMATIYKGFDYNYGSTTNAIYDVINHTKLYHSVSELKKECTLWIEAEKLAKENPKEYHVTGFSIASDDCGEPFDFGDCMSGKFNIKIIAVKVI